MLSAYGYIKIRTEERLYLKLLATLLLLQSLDLLLQSGSINLMIKIKI